MTEATERPWVILDTNRNGDIYFGPVSGGQVGLVQPHPLRTPAEQEASAELLVRAATADDAAQALAEAAEQFLADEESTPLYIALDAALAAYRAARGD